MLFNSINFLVFFPAMLLIYFVIPKKMRSIWLLICSYYFYMSFNVKFVFLIAAVTLSTYIGGYILEKTDTLRKKRIILGSFITANILLLFSFKYLNFAIENLNHILDIIGVELISTHFDFILPVGLSFYLFQAVGYMIDVYRGDIEAEKNIVTYGLYISFFPKISQGPIEKSKNLLMQFQKVQFLDRINWENVRKGTERMLWGYFQKLVIADRCAILVNNVYNSYSQYGFWELLIASVLFTIQIYCDFDGYTNIACGAAKIMGIDLMKNFRQPYLATNMVEFWKRWHISLTSWFTNYIYIPLGGNRKGKVRKNINTMIVFLVSGLWHGASWNFVAWGMIHGIFQIISKWKEDVRKKYNRDSINSWSTNFRKGLVTFFLVNFAWIFFRANGLLEALGILKCMTRFEPVVSIYGVGWSILDWKIILFSVCLLFLVDLLHERGKSVGAFLRGQEVWVRGLIYAGTTWFIILFGIYGTSYDVGQFMYLQF